MGILLHDKRDWKKAREYCLKKQNKKKLTLEKIFGRIVPADRNDRLKICIIHINESLILV